jgi:hypothetical protein
VWKDAVKPPWGERRGLAALWAVEACIAAGAVLTLVRGGAPRDMLATVAYFALCAACLALPGAGLRRALSAAGLSVERRRLVLQLYLAFAAAAVAAALGTARGWAAIVAILLTGNALLTLELDARGEVEQG